ncbi:MAG: AAA family ATPase, partial [Gammaproteobacteria bacterium]|nr:AAA family ATPase [Gammaproteobacteria bacterium]
MSDGRNPNTRGNGAQDNPTIEQVEERLAIQDVETDQEFESKHPQALLYQDGTEILRADDQKLQVRTRRWLVPNLIQRGRVTIFAGPPGQGKSKAACALIAACSRGEDFAGFPANKTSILLYSNEDDFEEDTLPCLINEKADLSQIHLARKHPNATALGIDANILIKEVRDKNVGLLVIDPAVDLMLGHKLQIKDVLDVRTMLAPLQRICRDTGCTVVALMHFRKGSGQKDTGSVLDRILGSGAFGQVARTVIAFAPSQQHPAEEFIRLMAVVKSQQAKPQGAIPFTIETDDSSPHPDTATVKFDPENMIIGTAEQVLSENPVNQRDLCVQDIIEHLDAAGGWVQRKHITDQIQEEYSAGTINRAFTFLNQKRKGTTASPT